MLRSGIFVMLVLVGLLLVAVGALYVGQRGLIYFPSRLSAARFAAEARATYGAQVRILAPFDAVVIEPPVGIPVRATAILFHGNAGLGIERRELAAVFQARGLRLILAEYPGYGAREGAPSERALVEDGEALYGEVLRQYPASPLMLVGESLGAGVAVQVAVRQVSPPPRLILLTPFLSLADTAARVYPVLPARYLLKDRFDSAGELHRYRGTVAILVAADDEVVGAAQGRALAALAKLRGETICVELPQAGHNSWIGRMTDERWATLLGLPPTPAAL